MGEKTNGRSEGFGQDQRAGKQFVPKPDVASRLRDALGLLDAIEQGELLAGVPSVPGDRRRHAAGAAILSVLTRDLESLLSEVLAYDELTAFTALESAAMGLRPTTTED